MDFNKKIKALRLELGATLEDIGNQVGVSKATVQRWESGDIANLRRDKIAKLAKALHTTPSYLLGWDDDFQVSADIPILTALFEYCDRYGKDKEQIIRFYQEHPASFETLLLGKPPKALDELTLHPVLGMSIVDACSAVGFSVHNSNVSVPEPGIALPVPESFSINPNKTIPLLGQIAAGLPLYAEENIEGYIWTDRNHGGEYFGLRVRGDSMNAANINDGDIIIVRKQDIVEDGDIAVVLVDDEATVKRYSRRAEAVVLSPQSTNPANQTQIYDLSAHTIRILGRVVESRTEY